MQISEIGIVTFGALAIYLVGLKPDNPWQRWGYICGLCSQPFWFYTTYHAEQWGIFGISVWYLYSWANGLRNNWAPN